MVKSGTISSGARIKTIDIMRALTMFLMIFVNDLWSLTGVPKWLGHTLAQEDGMGFSDVIFPLFLFIVGLSIPLAIDIRSKRKESHWVILGHVITRTIALVVMGFYMVNYEVINQEATGLNKNIWQMLMATALFLIWMDYKRLPNLGKGLVLVLKVSGLMILMYLAWIYKGGTLEDIHWMQPHWWGILGLIGWAYLLNALVYLFSKKRLWHLLPIFFILLLMNVQENGYFEWMPRFKIIISASNHVLVMAGMLCTVFYLKFKKEGKRIHTFLMSVVLAGILLVIYGFLIRPVFPISKILATPSWNAICIGISLLSYALLYSIIDKGGLYKWAKPIMAAGTSTLTCYVMPYFVYPAMVLLGIQWSDFFSNGLVGITRSLLFSLAIIVFVRMLEKRNIRLRV